VHTGWPVRVDVANDLLISESPLAAELWLP